MAAPGRAGACRRGLQCDEEHKKHSMERTISKSGIGRGNHKKGLSKPIREGAVRPQETARERFCFGKNYHVDTEFLFFSKRSNWPSVALIHVLKSSKAEKMDMSCIPGKIIGH